jgi:hypothetical protein
MPGGQLPGFTPQVLEKCYRFSPDSSSDLDISVGFARAVLGLCAAGFASWNYRLGDARGGSFSAYRRQKGSPDNKLLALNGCFVSF